MILAAVSGCSAGDKSSGTSLPTDKYVAIEEHLETIGTIIEGNDKSLPHITLPAIFSYDGSQNGSNWVSHTGWEYYTAVKDNYYPAVNDSFKVLFGTTYYRQISPSSTVTGVRIRGIYSDPYVGQSGFVLRDVDRNGTVHGSYNNTSIVLGPGEQWFSPDTIEIKSGNGTGFDQKPFSYTASFNSTWTITNLGVFDKSNLTQYNNSATAFGYSQVFQGADPAEK